VGLQGRYVGASAIVLGADQITSIEQIVMLSGGDARFGSDGLGYSYDLTTNNGNVAAGGTLVITANTLRSDESLTFNGSAETDGRFRIFSGDGADSIRGSAGADDIFGRGGNDSIVGGLGGDVLNGGAGNDRFIYTSVADSTAAARDTIADFAAGDLIDLLQVDANSAAAGDQAFTFIGAAAFRQHRWAAARHPAGRKLADRRRHQRRRHRRPLHPGDPGGRGRVRRRGFRALTAQARTPGFFSKLTSGLSLRASLPVPARPPCAQAHKRSRRLIRRRAGRGGRESAPRSRSRRRRSPPPVPRPACPRARQALHS
jgi:hypothetical protein